MDEKVIDGSSVPVGHTTVAQSWKASPYLVLVDPLHSGEECQVTANRSVELAHHNLCDVRKLESPRVKVDKQYVLFLTPGGPGSFVLRHA